MLKQEVIWYDCREKLPDFEGTYLVIKGYNYYDIEMHMGICKYGKFYPCEEYFDGEGFEEYGPGKPKTGWYIVSQEDLLEYEVIDVLFWAETYVPEEFSKG